MPATPAGVPYPAATATPDVPRDLLALAQWIEDHLSKFKDAEYTEWATYVPVVTQGTYTMTRAGFWRRIGHTVHARVSWAVTAVSAGAVAATVTLPLNLAASELTGAPVAAPIIGKGIYRTNAGLYVGAYATVNTASTFKVFTMIPNQASPNMGALTAAQPAGQAIGDQWTFDLMYECA